MRPTFLAAFLSLSLTAITPFASNLAFAQTAVAEAVAAAEAEAVEPSEADVQAQMQAFVDKLKFQTGDIRIGNAKAIIHANEQYRFLGAKDAQSVLEDLWGNPPDNDILGMIVSSKDGLLGDQGWAVVLTYSSDGYISDSEATGLDYDQILEDQQAGTRESNAERKRQGYGPIELHGWAARPRYDKANAKLYWAKDLSFDKNPEHTLNYDVRALGRNGYLSMNAIASMKQIKEIETAMQSIIQMAEFEPGARYADFDASTDRTAEYGLAALLGAGLAAKTGLLGKLLVLLLAFKKFAVFIVVGLFYGIKSLFSWRSRKKANAAANSNVPPPMR
jgi:uncharacterized membrane-anchored protein